MKELIVGIDVSRSSITACFLLARPSNPRDDYFNADIEVYHSNLENLNRLKTKIDSFGAELVIAICEPTGMNYATLWMNKLSDLGCEVRMISNSKLPNYRAELMRKEGKSSAKTDDIDAFAIACWYYDKEEQDYLRIRKPILGQIKYICLRLEHLNRIQNPIINRKGLLLGAIYPIKDFLKEGKPEVKVRKNRQTGKTSKLKLSERRFMRAVGMGVIRDDSGDKKRGKQSGSALCRKALWQWLFTRIERKKGNVKLEFQYGEGKKSERMSPSENFQRRKAGGTPIKLARQRVIAKCIRELFKELSAIATDTTHDD